MSKKKRTRVRLFVFMATFAAVLMLLAIILGPPERCTDQYIYGHIRIPTRNILAEVYTTAHSTDCGCASALWNGGKITVNADLSDVEIGDMADLRTLDGLHLVLECINIRKGLEWLVEPNGDILVINDRWICRFIIL